MLKSDLPVNAGPSEGSGWWLPLLEKAYAKMNVNYENLNNARIENVKEALRALTGMPVKEFPTRRKKFVKQLKELQNRLQLKQVCRCVLFFFIFSENVFFLFFFFFFVEIP